MSKLSLSETLDTLARMSHRLENFKKHPALSILTHNVELVKSAIVEFIGPVPSRFRDEAVRKWAEKTAGSYVLDTEPNTEEIVARHYLLLQSRLKQVERIIKLMHSSMNTIMSGLRIRVNSAEYVVKNLSISPSQKKAQITMLYNSKPVTRHLQFRDGNWYGFPPIAEKIMGFVVYDIG